VSAGERPALKFACGGLIDPETPKIWMDDLGVRGGQGAAGKARLMELARARLHGRVPSRT
jgi:hypothetical protein